MALFSAARQFLDDVRITMSFPAYEDVARQKHRAAAERRFSTVELSSEIESRMAPSMRAAHSRFHVPIERLAASIHDMERELTEQQDGLILFMRDYSAELEPLYQAKQEYFQRLRSVETDLKAAYEELSDAISSLNSWYARSEGTFFGNGRRQLPRHSMFGQSTGDRDSLKSDRDAAGNEISRLKVRRTELKRNLANYVQQINSVKADRQSMFVLRDKGASQKGLEQSMQRLRQKLDEFVQEKRHLTTELDHYIRAGKFATGTVSLEHRRAEVERLRSEFINTFDAQLVVAARKELHKVEWMRSHGRTAQG
jgi:chromosome segregation ATPase